MAPSSWHGVITAVIGNCGAARLIQQMELGLEELEAAVTEDEIAAETLEVIPRNWKVIRIPPPRTALCG